MIRPHRPRKMPAATSRSSQRPLDTVDSAVPLEYTAYVRAYERPGDLAVRRSPGPFPPHIDKWFDSRFREREVLAGRVSFYGLESLVGSMVIPDADPIPLILQRAVVDTPRLRLAEAIVWVDEPGVGLPSVVHDQYWNLLLGTTSFRFIDSDGVPETVALSVVWDRMITAFCGCAPTGWRRTGFGSLDIFVEEPARAAEVAREAVTDSSTRPIAVAGHHVVVDRNRCTVALPDEVSQREIRGGYLLLTALLGRSRHFSWTLLDDITALADDSAIDKGGSAATAVLARAADLQRRAVLARREMRASDHLGDPSLIAVFHRAASVAVSDYERRTLDDCLEGLDRLGNGVFAVASDRAQQRLNQVGFVIALISVLLAAAGVTDLVSAPPEVSIWVYIVWIISLLALMSVVVFSRARTSISAVLRRTGPGRRSNRSEEASDETG